MRRTMGDYNLERETSTSWGKKKTRGKIYKVTHKLSSNFVGKLIFMLFYVVFLVDKRMKISNMHVLGSCKNFRGMVFYAFFSLFVLQWLG